MNALRTLRGRLIASYVLLIAAITAAGLLTVSLLTPALFQRQIQARDGSAGGRGTGTPQTVHQIEDAYNDALTVALVVAGVVGLVLAIALAYLFTRRLLRSLDEIQEATRRLAVGDYRTHLPEPDEAELADLAGSINTLGSALATTEQARARLVSDLAHELRTPLTTIEGSMEGLIDGVLPPTQQTFESVADEAHRLKRLTEDLSLLSRTQEGALQLNLEHVDLGDIAQRVVDRLRPQYESKNVTLVLDLDDALPVTADADRLIQAVTNVIGNALVHTPEAGTVTVAGDRDSDVCRLSVIDNGEGIPSDQLEAIFGRFTRLDHDKTGTGIGLHIARSLARAHDGDLTADSNGPGTGATFVFTLPASSQT
jgi:histidine kinase